MRKNLFGIQKQTNIVDGASFIVREAEKNSQEKIEKASENVQDIGGTAKTPGIINILNFLLLFTGVYTLMTFFNLLENEETDIKPYTKFIYLGVCIVAFALAILINVLMKKRANKIMNSDQFNKSVEYLSKQIEDVKNELNIPLDAIDVDVFTEMYVEKNGKRQSKLPFGTYALAKCAIFVEGDKLCLSDCYSVYAIALSSIKSIDKIDKKVSFIGWTKEKPYNDELFKEFCIKQNGYGIYTTKLYYSIKIDDELGEFEILVPNYEINNFLKYINLTISESENK